MTLCPRAIVLGLLAVTACTQHEPKTPQLTTFTNDPSQSYDDGGDDDPGHATQPCDGGECLGDLVCVDDRCIDPDQPATSGSTSGPTSGADPSTDGAATTTPDPTPGSTSDPTADPDEPRFCVEYCDVSSDCKIGGQDVMYTCVDHSCQQSDDCDADSDCIPPASGWNLDCDDQSGCPGQACIDIGGGIGKCATVPSDFFMCETIDFETVEYPAIDGGFVDVCANTDRRCDPGGHCKAVCQADADCEDDISRPHCNKTTGACGCSTDQQCQIGAGLGQCVDGKCRCTTDDECFGQINADKCYDGLCGCDANAVCSQQTFDGTTPTCRPA